MLNSTMGETGPGTWSMTGRGRFLAALRGEHVDRPPVWFMRQAGRHLPGYRRIRERMSFLEVCADSEANVEVSSEPWRRYGVDAAIVFNDILTPIRDMGLALDFTPGPRFERLLDTTEDVESLGTPAYGADTDVARCVAALRRELGDDGAVLGFVGAPMTVGAYPITGAGDQARTTLADAVGNGLGAALEAIQDRLVPVLVEYARAQVEAGADVIQVFESSAAELTESVYRRVGLATLLEIVRQLRRVLPGTPVIVFGRGIWPYVTELAEAGASAVSLDWERPLSEARAMLRRDGLTTALQGNLRSDALLGTAAQAKASARALLEDWRGIAADPGRGPTGWVFNLGHGVPRNADPDVVQAVVDTVTAYEFGGGHNGRIGR